MSRETIALITDLELRCYVCGCLIHDLKRNRTVAKQKSEDAYFTDRAFKLRQKTNQRVTEITGSLDKRRVFRHTRCDPTQKHFTVEDL